MDTVQRAESWRDEVAELLAHFSVGSVTVDETMLDGVRRVLLDSLAVALGAHEHPAAVAARRYLALFPSDAAGPVVWGTGHRASPDKATLVNGVPLRCYDYNDVYFGHSGAGHPSDMVAALLTVADWTNASGAAFAEALAVGYEAAALFFNTLPAEERGWDHANLSALGATCGVARLLSLSADETAEALGIAALQHLQSDEIESSALNRRGDLTLWKRFHGADAMRHAVDSCLLAKCGAEGAVRPFQGKLGLLAIMGDDGSALEKMTRLLPKKGRPLRQVGQSTMKRWPVGSRGQSAIQAALAAYRQLPAGAEIAEVRVTTEPEAYRHLVAIRQDPWRPVSRETADHSLPYIVGAAVLDGCVDVHSFDLDRVLDPARARFIAETVKVAANERLADQVPAIGNASTRYLTRVEIVTGQGDVFVGQPAAPPGHADNPLTLSDLSTKMHECADGLYGAPKVDRIMEEILGLGGARPIRALTLLLVRGEGAAARGVGAR